MRRFEQIFPDRIDVACPCPARTVVANSNGRKAKQMFQRLHFDLESFPSPFIGVAVLPVFVRHNVSMPILIVSHVEDEGSNLQISRLLYVTGDGHG